MKYLLGIIYSMSLIFMISSKNVADFAMIDYINSVQDHWTAHNSPRFENTTFNNTYGGFWDLIIEISLISCRINNK